MPRKNTHHTLHSALILIMLSAISGHSAHAEDCYLDTDDNGTGDSTASAESNGGNVRLACGPGATATGTQSTAVGAAAKATEGNSTAIGAFTDSGQNSTAVGMNAVAKSRDTTAVGFAIDISAIDSPGAIAIGSRSKVGTAASGAIAIGGDSNNSDGLVRGADAFGAHSIALGDEARTNAAAAGGIAIGGDADGDGLGAQATAANAIALGADVVADIADQMFVGVPVRVVPKSVGVSEKVLMRLNNNGGVNFKLNDTSVADGEWTFRTGSQGGKFVIGKTGSGVQEFEVLSGGNVRIAGTLTQASSRTRKENIQAIAHQDILNKVLALPISEWNYIHDRDTVRHIGPMAEDFYRLFNVGSTPKGISSIDASGIALAAIQGLKRQLDDKDARLEQQAQEIAALERRLALLESAKTK